jgi:phospholipid transport system transporter-binding protein
MFCEPSPVSTRLDGDRLVLEGPLNAGTVPGLLEAGDQYLRDGLASVDFGSVGDVDSSAIALALEWLRDARAAGRNLAFVNIPPAMQNLARLYGVAEFLAPEP